MKFKVINQSNPHDFYISDASEVVGEDVVDEFVKLWQKHCERITKMLMYAGYTYRPSCTYYPVIDNYSLVRFEFSILWDKLSEIQKRIRENLPDQTSLERQAEKATSCLS